MNVFLFVTSLLCSFHFISIHFIYFANEWECWEWVIYGQSIEFDCKRQTKHSLEFIVSHPPDTAPDEDEKSTWTSFHMQRVSEWFLNINPGSMSVSQLVSPAQRSSCPFLNLGWSDVCSENIGMENYIGGVDCLALMRLVHIVGDDGGGTLKVKVSAGCS